MHRRIVPLLAVLLAGCSSVISLSPAIPAASAVMDDRLLGEWIADDTSRARMRVRITRREDRSYHLRIIEGADTSTAIGRLMPVGQRLLLDLSPTGEAARAIDRYNGIPVNLQVVLDMSDDIIRASTIHADTLRARERSGTGPALALAYPPSGDVLLTDSTPRLSAGLAQYLSRHGVVGETRTYRRSVTHTPSVPRSATRARSFHVAGTTVGAAPENDPVRKRMLLGALIGAAGGAIIGVVVADPSPRVMFSGREYGALGGGLLGAIAGAIVGALTGALNQ
jgi:hypothetical protein